MIAKDKVFWKKKILNTGGKVKALDHPLIMGIINITPDSFFSGSRSREIEDTLIKARQHNENGADILDLGGYSTRPGADEVSIDEELERVIPAVEKIAEEFPDITISIDTFRSQVAARAIEAGAHMVNDVSGGTLDENMFDTIAHYRVPYILMHMRGDPKTMTQKTEYNNVVQDVISVLQTKLFDLEKRGVGDVIIDPGFGFAKTVEQNFELLSNLQAFQILERPILAGLSRKSMIWRTLKVKPEDALNGTTALNSMALLKGANILRVHDVKETKEIIQLFKFINN